MVVRNVIPVAHTRFCFRCLNTTPPVRLGRFLSEQVNAELEREAKEKYAESMNGAVQRK